MGDMADYYRDLSMLDDIEREFGERGNLENKLWLQKSGKKIEISKMTTDHIKNTLNMIREDRIGLTYDKEWQKLFEKELTKRINE